MAKKEEEVTVKLDCDYYEMIVIVNALKNKEYVSAIIEHVDLDYFKNVNNRIFIEKILEFFKERGCSPALEELKARLTTTDEKKAFTTVVTHILTKKLLEVDFNQEELYHKTEKFLKDRGLYKAIDIAAEKHDEGEVDLDDTLKSIEKI